MCIYQSIWGLVWTLISKSVISAPFSCECWSHIRHFFFDRDRIRLNRIFAFLDSIGRRKFRIKRQFHTEWAWANFVGLFLVCGRGVNVLNFNGHSDISNLEFLLKASVEELLQCIFIVLETRLWALTGGFLAIQGDEVADSLLIVVVLEQRISVLVAHEFVQKWFAVHIARNFLNSVAVVDFSRRKKFYYNF